MLENIDPVVQGASGVGVVGIALRLLYSWSKRQGHIDRGIDRNDKYIEQIERQAKEWEQRHKELMDQHEEHMEQISLLRMQNVMLRQLLIAKGMTESELAAIGAIL